ncbi:sensor histidine kinase [Cellulomonas taurus]|uniref:sensor histidine kinase n=1 Tax=Cellulomonas taurus TaxID=2729175 RepID=UPI00145C68AE|nr:nitrate- and nitrite sensing domain-containing protein [Cellulomonas taurus]
MLRRLGIRAKVLAVLALPVLVLLVASAYISVQSVGQARTAAAVSRVVQVLPQYAAAVEALQQERTLSVQEAGGNALSGSLSAARTATDNALATLSGTAAGLDTSGLDARVGEAIDAAQIRQSDVTDIRERVDNGTVPVSVVDSNFTSVITAHNDVPALIAETLSNRSLASRLTAYAQVAETVERVLRAQPTALEVFGDDGADASKVQELAARFAVEDEVRAEARATTNNLRLDGIQLPSRDADLVAMQLSLESGNTLTISALDQTRWNALVNGELATLRPVASDLLESAGDQASALAAAAQRQSAITIGITIAATALSIVIAFLVSRGIVIPLRRLTSAAGEVREELPRLVEQVAEPGKAPDLSLAEIPVTSQDEVGRLAAAFNSVNATTIQVARDQAALRGSIAEMFVNVARRDQVLLGRQLAFIDSLERAEEDPATLANLFRLDHLATRMRRNAESLLVLAGIDSGRRLREAMPLSDVVRTASSEIEQYDRVQLELGVDPLMHGFNALAAAHLMAELLENATLFSEPGTPVFVRTAEVSGERTGDRQVLVTIVDQGLGMSDEELAEANNTIGSAAATDAIGAQRLGLFVVARLAARLGAAVTLSRVTDGGSGTVATVAFPGQLFTAEPTAVPGGGLAAAATGAVPVVEPEAPAAVPVDLAALTDGATGTGLPRRRTGPGAEPAEEQREVVLPAPAEATLSPEITAASTGWTPAVPAQGGAGLPSRGAGLPTRDALPSRRPADASATASGTGAPDGSTTPAVDAGPRSGLFAGFRGRSAVAGEPTPAQAESGSPDSPGAERTAPGIESPAEASPFAAPLDTPQDSAEQDSSQQHDSAEPDSAPQYQGPQVDGHQQDTDQHDADQHDADHSGTPSQQDEPAEQPAAFVVPMLMPDEDQPVDPAWGERSAWGEPLAVDSFGEPVDPFAAAPADQQDLALPAWDVPVEQDPAPSTWTAATEPQPAPLGWDEARAPETEQTGSRELPFAVPEPFAPIGSFDQPWVDDHQAVAAPTSVDTDPAAGSEQPEAAPSAPEAAPVAATGADAGMPDFATLVRGDGTDDVPARRRERGRTARRPLFSLGRRRKSAEPRPVTGAHKLIGATELGSTPPAVSAAPAGTPDVAPGWAPAPTWAPQETPATDTAWSAGPATDAVASGWTVTPEPAAAPASPSGDLAWSPSTPSLPHSSGEGSPAPVVPAQAAPAAATPPQGWSPQQPTADTPWTPDATPVTPAPLASGGLPTRVRGEVPAPVDDTPAPTTGPRRDMSGWASAWSSRGAAPAEQPATAAPAAPTGWAPEQAESDLGAGAFGAQGASTLAMRADIQEQALSELSQLSAYRPKSVDRPAASLVRRTPNAVPEAPAIAPSTASAPRDADAVRDRLSSFQSGTRRGRRALADGDGSDQAAQPTPIS